MEDAKRYRLKALEASKQAEATGEPGRRDHLRRMERSYLLLARNAEWLHKASDYLREERKRRWSAPL